MEINDGNLQTLAGFLEKTLLPDPTERRAAEKFLQSVEGNQNYPILLLSLIAKDEVSQHIRQASAIMFKNYIKRNWRVIEDIGDRIHAQDRVTVKQEIVGLMLKSPEQVQKQLSDAISIIGREDFPDKWPNLLPEMVAKFDSSDFNIINGVLRTAHSIFKRYRHEFKSDALWREILFVLRNFAAPLTLLLDATMALAAEHATSPAALRVIFSSLLLICKIFYSLNFQDIPEYFEDNMARWMGHFHTLLTTTNSLLATQDEEEAGLLEQVKSQICDNITMYAQKYDEEFSSHLPTFVDDVWHLLTNTGLEVKYDLLVSNAIQFLASVAERPGYKHLFESPGTLASICEKVIVPNMQFRASDEESFEINPDEYIRRDIGGADHDTRRRAACDLVRALSKSFEGPVITNFSQYVESMLADYAASPVTNWKSKDAAVYLVTSLAAKAQTEKHGVTQTSQLVNLLDFFQAQILPELKRPDVNATPVLKAGAIKYVIVFRSLLPKQALVACIPRLVVLLNADSAVVHSYASHALERVFMIKADGGAGLIIKEDIAEYAEPLLTNLFAALDREGSSENEYVMKAVMRTFSILQGALLPYVGVLVGKLTEKLVAVAKNPSKPHFNHYLFESICVAVRITCKAEASAVQKFEDGLFPPFQGILQNDVQEFMPYVFQILSLLLELHVASLPASYEQLFPHLLQPVLWERLANIPPLVRLLQAYIEKGGVAIAGEKITGLLGIFQKLIASKSNDHQGFYLLNTIIEALPQDILQTYIKQVFCLLFQRLSSSKTTKFVKSMLVFFSVYMIKYGAVSLVELVDGIQGNLFGMVIEKCFLTDTQKISGSTEKKIVAVGLTKVLTDAPVMFSQYDKFWPQLLQCLVGLFELPEDETVPDDEHFIEIEDTPGYQAAYSQLVFAGKKASDPCQVVPDAKLFLAQSLARLSQAHPGKIGPLISQLEPQAQTYLQQYLLQAGVTLA